ncbi:MAG: sulfotransferase, partial [Proteobacteria bacterium]|nr:sulfotransferase [Pseudomonadota bacterium]
HIASYLKQNRLFCKISKENPRLSRIIEITGHHEFGPQRHYINTGNHHEIQEIRSRWDEGHEVEACARYWSSIYSFVADQLASNPKLRHQVLLVRYEDLCTDSADTIDRIVEHTGLDASSFSAIKAEYIEKLQPPGYYKQKFDAEEQKTLLEIVGPTASRFGYHFHEHQ